MFDKLHSAELCEDLSLRRGIPALLRDEARYQLYFHLDTADKLFPNWTAHRLDFVPPPGWMQMNPSIAEWNNSLYIALRCCNYRVDYRGPRSIDGTPYFSRTFLLSIDPDDLHGTELCELALARSEDSFKPGVPLGFEDARIIAHSGSLWAIMTRCTQNPEGWPEQWIAEISDREPTLKYPRKLAATGRRKPEKNWMPFISAPIDLLGEQICYLYSCDPTTVLLSRGQRALEHYPPIACEHFRGSSQGVATVDGGYLAIVHSVVMFQGYPKYYHRFIKLNSDYQLAAISSGFTLPTSFDDDILNGYQYIMGLCAHPTEHKLCVSYSLGDCQAWIATIDLQEATSSLRSVVE